VTNFQGDKRQIETRKSEMRITQKQSSLNYVRIIMTI